MSAEGVDLDQAHRIAAQASSQVGDLPPLSQDRLPINGTSARMGPGPLSHLPHP